MKNLHQYAKIKSRIQNLNQELEELKPGILKEIGRKGSISNGFGTFAKKFRSNYKFTKSVDKREFELKRLKAWEIARGYAKESKTRYLSYRFPNSKL